MTIRKGAEHELQVNIRDGNGGCAPENDTIADDWCEKHPERRLDTLMVYDFDPY